MRWSFLFVPFFFAFGKAILNDSSKPHYTDEGPRLPPHSFEKTESQLRKDIIDVAISKVGVAKYEWGKPPPDTGLQYDCSGFTQWMTVEALTYNDFPEKLGSGQWKDELEKKGARLASCDEAKPGDVIYWEGHIGLIADPVAGTFVGAQGKEIGITVESFREGHWSKGKTCYTNKFLVRDNTPKI